MDGLSIEVENDGFMTLDNFTFKPMDLTTTIATLEAAPAEVDEAWLEANARDLIPWFAREKKADLVVMGAIARWGLRNRVIGSTAEKVLDDLPCDILIVRPD